MFEEGRLTHWLIEQTAEVIGVGRGREKHAHAYGNGLSVFLQRRSDSIHLSFSAICTCWGVSIVG